MLFIDLYAWAAWEIRERGGVIPHGRLMTWRPRSLRQLHLLKRVSAETGRNLGNITLIRRTGRCLMTSLRVVRRRRSPVRAVNDQYILHVNDGELFALFAPFLLHPPPSNYT